VIGLCRLRLRSDPWEVPRLRSGLSPPGGGDILTFRHAQVVDGELMFSTSLIPITRACPTWLFGWGMSEPVTGHDRAGR
jgi:hypothetical protein